MFRLIKYLIVISALVFVLVVTLAYFSEPAPLSLFQPKLVPEVIAHSGGAGVFPSNTLPAYRHASKLGVDILEMDLHSSSDGYLVLIHDRTVDRTTNGQGEVRQKSLKELQTLDAGYYFSANPDLSNPRDFKKRVRKGKLKTVYPLRGKSIRIPTLKEVFETFPDMRLIIEIKQKSPSVADRFCGMIRDYGKQHQVLVASFSDEVMEEFRSACPEVATSLASWEATRFILMSRLWLSRTISPQAVALQVPEFAEIPKLPRIWSKIKVVNRKMVLEAHRKNLAVHVWTVNDKEQMKRLIAVGVDGIMTDYPGLLLELLKEKKPTQDSSNE